MSLHKGMGKITQLFNWLTEEPNNHFTLRQFLPLITDGQIQVQPPRPINRFARALERVSTVAGLGAGLYYGIALNDWYTGSLIMVGSQLGAWVGGAMGTVVLEKMHDISYAIESALTSMSVNSKGKARDKAEAAENERLKKEQLHAGTAGVAPVTPQLDKKELMSLRRGPK